MKIAENACAREPPSAVVAFEWLIPMIVMFLFGFRFERNAECRAECAESFEKCAAFHFVNPSAFAV